MDLNQAKRSMVGYLAELAQVPEALERLCQSVNVRGVSPMRNVADQIRDSSEVFVFGMASSQWASLPMVWGLKQRGVRVHLMPAYEGLFLPLSRMSKRSLVVLISQSGETIEIRRLLDRMIESPAKPFIVGVTNLADSYLSANSDLVLNIHAGQEIHAPSKTYVNTLATLLLVYSFLVGESRSAEGLVELLLDISSRMARCQDTWMSWGENVASSWSGTHGRIQFLALGPQMASAWQSSMLCSEITRVFSAAGNWATFRHGFEPQVDDSFLVFGFKPFESEIDVWRTAKQSILGRGGRVFLVPSLFDRNAIGHRKEGWFHEDMISPVWETLPVHWFCIGLAKLRGLDASQIERKVTRTL